LLTESDRNSLNTAILRLCRSVYSASLPVLCGDNTFLLRASDAVFTISSLPRSSRTFIKHIKLEISKGRNTTKWLPPIFKGCLRYWSALEDVTILLRPTTSEENRGDSEEEDIPLDEKLIIARCEKKELLEALRWLPKKCRVEFAGALKESVQNAIQEHEQSRKALDNVGLRYPSVL
jgi:hypothetical protein